MKRLTLLLLMAVSALGAMAEDEFTGMVTTLSKASSLSTDQWYAVYNPAANVFVYDDGSGSLSTHSTPAMHLAADYLGCFVMLESTGNCSFYLKTAQGNYIGELSSEVTATSPTERVAYTVANVDGDAEVWSLSNNGKYLGGGMCGEDTQSDATSWTFYTVTLKSEDDLTASQRLTFQKNMFHSDSHCLARFYNRKTADRYLTSKESGVANGSALVSKTELSQIWLMTYKGSDSYTLRNASTGEFLTGTYGTPGAETTLYIQQSLGNGDDDCYYNISSSSSFSGQTCLNLKEDGTTLTKWTCGTSNPGSDWAAEIVTEVSVDDVIEHLDESDIYASELTSGAYYRIVNHSYGLSMAEGSGVVKCQTEDDSSYAQYWQLISSENGWQIRNVQTGNYIQRQTTTYQQYRTSTTPVTFYITRTDDDLTHAWNIANSEGGTQGMHCDSSKKVVPWTTTGITASEWLFLEVELSEEEIEEAQAMYAEYNSLVDNLSEVQSALDNLFSDKACTALKDGIASLTDEQLASNSDYASLPAAIQEMVLKVKNDAWELPATGSTVTDSYEKFFRIAEYKPYSHFSTMAGNNYTGQSTAYGKLSGPTGIFLDNADILYLYVDQDASSDCTLQVEVVSTDGVPGDHPTGTTTSLKAGLNVLMATEQVVVYIFYQLDNPDKYLADYPDIKVHIEGGTVNGCFDATRGMTNQDWANMKALGLLSKCPVLNLKTEHLVFAMASDLVLSAMTAAHTSEGDEMEDAEKLLRIWEMIPVNEESYQGLEGLEGRFRNVWNCFSVDYNYMFSTTYGTYYNNSTLGSVMNYYKLTHMGEGNGGGSLWGPSHEMGHNHQGAIKLIGTTESSNNLFSNINIFEQGISTTRGGSPVINFDNYLANGSSWLDRDIWVTTRMFFQLYLYFHVMEGDTSFLPNLFKALRSDPITKGSWDNSLKADTDGDGTVDVTGGYKSYGKNDYLKFAQKVCDVAQADLSEFFEAYGMFVPVTDQYSGDYSSYFVTTTESDIKAARKSMQKYERKLGNIMFIDDHIEKKLADPDNKFEAVPASDGYKVNCQTGNGYQVGLAGDCGDYEAFDGHTEYDVTGDYCTIQGSTITFHGSGYIGHKFYDLDGNLVWACNKSSATLPSSVKSLFPDSVVVVAAEENMNDVPCPYFERGSRQVYRMQVSFPDSVSNEWWAATNIDAYLPANAIAVIGTSDAPEALVSSVNVVDTDSTAESLVIDGDLECRIPQGILARSLRFTKSTDGFQALSLPFQVSNANTIVDEAYVNDVSVPSGEPLVTSSLVSLRMHDVSVNAGSYTMTAGGYALSGDGSAVEWAEDISPFTYLFSEGFELGNLTPVASVPSVPQTGSGAIYDLNGRRLVKADKPGIYIIGGKKVVR